MKDKQSLWIIFLLLINVLFGCAKVPSNQSSNNDNILSGNESGGIKNGENNNHYSNGDIGIDSNDYPENSGLYLGKPFTTNFDAHNFFNHYLINRQYLNISYNHTKFIPNWVAWHLDNSNLGTVIRTEFFYSDPFLPFTWVWVDYNSYTNSGFDRGHNCPSGDRNATEAMNMETFYMTNIIPQAPNLNQKAWVGLENYIRTIIKDSIFEAYIYNGNFGIGGENANGVFRKIKNNTGTKYLNGSYDSIWIPKYIFKIVLFIAEGKDDSARIMANDGNHVKILAVLMPNSNSFTSNDTWKSYITTIQSIEDSIQVYKEIETDVTNNAASKNPLNPPMNFLSKIPDGLIKNKFKQYRWANP